MRDKWYRCADIEMPTDRQFLIYFRDEINLCEWSERDQLFYFIADPAASSGISYSNDKILNRITHWSDLPEKPQGIESNYEK